MMFVVARKDAFQLLHQTNRQRLPSNVGNKIVAKLPQHDDFPSVKRSIRGRFHELILRP